MNYPGPSKIVIGTDRVAKIYVTRPRAYYSRAATQRLEQGMQEVEVEFPTPMKDANWVFGALTFWNTADSNLDKVHLQALGITAKSQSGFTVLLNGVPPTDNYYLDWSIAEAYNP